MPILSDVEAMKMLDYTTVEDMPDKVSDILIPAVNEYLKDATGKDWGTITETYIEIDPVAKVVASILLVRWFEDPGQIDKVSDIGLLSMVNQLEAKYLQEKQAAEEVV